MADEKQTTALPEPQPQPRLRDHVRACATSASARGRGAQTGAGLRHRRTRGAHPDGRHVLEEPCQACRERLPTSGPLAVSTDMNQRKIQELEQDLSADQRQSQQQATAQRTGAVAPTSMATATDPCAARRRVSCCAVAAACQPRSRPAIRSRMRKRHWPSRPALRRILSPPMTALRAHRRSLPTPVTMLRLALRACRHGCCAAATLRLPRPATSVRRR